MFTLNEAGWDRAARVALGLFLLALGWSGAVAGGLGVFLRLFGLVPLLTGLVGWCPLYSVFRFSTLGGSHRTPGFHAR